MKLKIIMVLVVSLMVNHFLHSQSKINYQNKRLTKHLRRNNIKDISQITELNIAESLKQFPIQGKFFVIKSEISQYKYIYIGRVNTCREGGCSISNDITGEGNSEYFDYYILFGKDKTVQAVKVFNYQATHGYEITAKGWLKQFIGYDGSESLKVNKNVDAISGATISVYGISFDVELKTKILKSL